MTSIEEAAAPAEVAAWESNGGYEPPKSMVGPIFFGALIQFVVCLGLTRSPIGEDAPRMIGGIIGTMLPAWLILYLGFGRRRDPRGWWKILLALLPATLLGLLLVAGKQATNEDAAMNSIVAAGQQMLDSDGSDLGSLSHSGATGEAGELERVVLDLLRTLAEDRRNYERDLAASGFSDTLLPTVLQDRSDVAEARRRASAGRAVIERYYSVHASRMASVPERFATADISRQARASATQGFLDSQRASNNYVAQMKALELRTADALMAVVDILARAQWRRNGEGFEFGSQADSDAFNARMSRINAVARQQEQLVSAQRRRMQSTLDSRKAR